MRRRGAVRKACRRPFYQPGSNDKMAEARAGFLGRPKKNRVFSIWTRRGRSRLLQKTFMKPLRFRFEVSSDTRHLVFLRQVFPAIASIRGVALTAKDVRNLTLLLIEAYNNAHFHAHGRKSSRRMDIELKVTQKTIVLELSDQGKGFAKKKNAMPKTNALHGRGLALMKVLGQKISFRKTKGRHTLQIRYATGQ